METIRFLSKQNEFNICTWFSRLRWISALYLFSEPPGHFPSPEPEITPDLWSRSDVLTSFCLQAQKVQLCSEKSWNNWCKISGDAMEKVSRTRVWNDAGCLNDYTKKRWLNWVNEIQRLSVPTFHFWSFTWSLCGVMWETTRSGRDRSCEGLLKDPLPGNTYCMMHATENNSHRSNSVNFHVLMMFWPSLAYLRYACDWDACARLRTNIWIWWNTEKMKLYYL